ncbi:putative aquaporin 5 [Mycena latifolia]|nr:putative aquaporin 5 [Mycena latifolia]
MSTSTINVSDPSSMSLDHLDRSPLQSPVSPRFNPLSPTKTLVHSPLSEPSLAHLEASPPGVRGAILRYRQTLRCAAAEFAGTMVLVLFGTGSLAQMVLTQHEDVAGNPKGDWLSVAFGFASGIALGNYIAGAVSGGHLNPAVTAAIATYRGFPWKKVPVYWLAQTMGAFTGAAIIYGNYFHAIDVYEGGRGIRSMATAGIFAPYPEDYMTNISCFFSEFLGSSLLVLVIFAVSDKGNSSPPKGLLPLALFMLLLAEVVACGMNTGFALNPARDLGPRILTAIAGYGGVFSYRQQYWLWCPTIAPLCGAQFGALCYDTFIYNGEDNRIINLLKGKPSQRQAAKRVQSNMA